jgi:hypothetical protein
MASSFTRFLDHRQQRTTFGRTPPDEWSARRRDLYLKTHNTHNRQTSMSPSGFQPTISAGERPQTYALDRAATGTGTCKAYAQYYIVICVPSSCTVFFHISHKKHSFRKKKILNVRCVFWFSAQGFSEIFLILRRNERDIIINVHRSSSTVFLTDFNQPWIFWTDIRKALTCHISLNFQWESSCFMWTNGHDEANSRFSQFWQRASKRLKMKVTAYTKRTFRKRVFCLRSYLHFQKFFLH